MSGECTCVVGFFLEPLSEPVIREGEEIAKTEAEVRAETPREAA
jgi:hypothetical protein